MATCSFHRRCTGDEATVEVTDEGDENGRRAFRDKLCCDSCLSDLRRDSHISLKITNYL